MLNQSLLTYLIYMYVLFYQVDFMVNNFYELFCLGKLLWLMIDILLITMNESRCYGALNEKCPHRFMYFILCSQGVVLFEIMYPTDSGIRQMLYVNMRTLGGFIPGPSFVFSLILFTFELYLLKVANWCVGAEYWISILLEEKPIFQSAEPFLQSWMNTSKDNKKLSW